MAEHNELGKKGEAIALKHLLKEGYSVIELNWRHERYEIDIIVSNDEFIVFVEVKTRTSDRWGKPSDAVSKGKIKRIVEAADYYLQVNDIDTPVRFDIISIVITAQKIEIEHIDDAFMAPIN